jgi:uncharacterized protein YgbK (DUF1537 family)
MSATTAGSGRRHLDFVVVSDDLTGALVAAAELVDAGVPTTVRSWSTLEPPHGVGAIVLDTASRLADADDARERAAAAITVARRWTGADATVLYKRIDTALRGNSGAELAAAARAVGRPALIAAAAPALGVSTVGGVQRQRGVPIVETHYGEGAEGAPSAAVADHLGGAAATTIDLDTVRSGELADALVRAVDVGHVVCDAEDDADLDAIALAALALAPRALMVGSVGFLAALARAGAARVAPGALAVVGSLKAATRAQLRCFGAHGHVVELAVDGDCIDLAVDEAAARLVAGDHVALTCGPGEPCEQVAHTLAAATAAVLERVSPSGVALVGGELASAVVARCAVRDIRVTGEPWPGIPSVRFSGGLLDGVRGHVKSGALGAEGWLSQSVATLEKEHP